MAQGIQRDPLGVASGGLPGLYGVTFSPLPPTEGDVAARRSALVPQFSGPSAAVMSTPIFRPTAQVILPTPLLRRPEEIGQPAFRPIREEVQFPALRPAETIEEIDRRLSNIYSALAFPAQAPGSVQPISTEGAGSIFEMPEAAPLLPGVPQLLPSLTPVSTTTPSTTTEMTTVPTPPDQYPSSTLPPPPPPPSPPQQPRFTLEAVMDQDEPLLTIIRAL